MSNINDAEQRLPLAEEQLTVTKRSVETDHVRIRTVVEDCPIVLHDVIERGTVEVTRVAVERLVNAPPEPRHEGDTLIVSIVEERPVIEKRLFVVEEVHVRRTVSHEAVSLRASARKMHAVVEHPQTQGPTDE